MAAAATERCRVWPKTAAQDVKYVRAHCHGAGSSRHPTFLPVLFGKLIHANVAESSAISCTVDLLLFRTIVLTLAIIFSLLDVDGRPEQGVAFSGGSELFNSTEPVKHLCTTNSIFTICLLQLLIRFCCGFSNFKTKLDANTFVSTYPHRKNGYDIRARVTSITYHSQLSKCSHLQLVS